MPQPSDIYDLIPLVIALGLFALALDGAIARLQYVRWQRKQGK